MLPLSPPSCMSQNFCSDLVFIVVSACPSYQRSHSSSFFSINFLSTMIFHFELVSPDSAESKLMHFASTLVSFLREVQLKTSWLVYNASHCVKIHREVGYLREVWSKPTNHIKFKGHTSENLCYTSAVRWYKMDGEHIVNNPKFGSFSELKLVK